MKSGPQNTTSDDDKGGQFKAHFGIKPNEPKIGKIQIDFLGSVSLQHSSHSNVKTDFEFNQQNRRCCIQSKEVLEKARLYVARFALYCQI